MNRASLETLSQGELIEIVLGQAERIAELEARLSGMEERFAELERQAFGGAAPFGRAADKRSASPKAPGRKGGHAGSWRARPADAEIDQHIDVPLETCPHCGAALDPEQDRSLEQTVIDIPAVRPEVTRLTTHRNRCPCCREPVASSHPLQVSRARGAAGTHLGPRALALAGSLSREFGLTMRKTCDVLAQLFGLPLSPGGLAQALGRMAERLRRDDAALLETVKSGPVLHTDETSWWVGGPGFSLWVLTTPLATLYRVVASRSRAQAEELLGDYRGVLVSDCLNIYDGLTPHQHKCYAHHIKAISKALEADPQSAYLTSLLTLLRGAIALKAEMPQLPADQIAYRRQCLEAMAERLLGPPAGQQEADDRAAGEKLRQRLLKQRDHLFTFLDHDQVPATNNLAERQLRPAVIARKLSCGNKTARGAQAWQVLASRAATCRQNGTSFRDFLIPRLAPAAAADSR